MAENRKPMGTIGFKDFCIAEVLSDTEDGTSYGEVIKVAGAIDATLTPENTDPEVQYADDGEYDVVYPDPEVTFRTKLVDLPLEVRHKVFGHKMDANGVMVKNANDKGGYWAVGFRSEKADHTDRYVWLYKVRAKPMVENYATKEGETITRQNSEIEWAAIKRNYDGNYQTVGDVGLNGFTEEKAKTFLSTVYEPVVAG